jgi:hypothetical protein
MISNSVYISNKSDVPMDSDQMINKLQTNGSFIEKNIFQVDVTFFSNASNLMMEMHSPLPLNFNQRESS